MRHSPFLLGPDLSATIGTPLSIIPLIDNTLFSSNICATNMLTTCDRALGHLWKEGWGVAGGEWEGAGA